MTLEESWKKALEGWKDIIENDGKRSHEKSECGLCEYDKLKAETENDDCEHCPIYIYTGMIDCDSTPYWKWSRNKTKENAQKEYDFLLKVKEET